MNSEEVQTGHNTQSRRRFPGSLWSLRTRKPSVSSVTCTTVKGCGGWLACVETRAYLRPDGETRCLNGLEGCRHNSSIRLGYRIIAVV